MTLIRTAKRISFWGKEDFTNRCENEKFLFRISQSNIALNISDDPFIIIGGGTETWEARQEQESEPLNIALKFDNVMHVDSCKRTIIQITHT
jgi:hypothetical protein